MASPLEGIPVYFSPYAFGVNYFNGVVVAKDRETLMKAIEFANQCESLGNACVEEILRRFNEWQRTCNSARSPIDKSTEQAQD